MLNADACDPVELQCTTLVDYAEHLLCQAMEAIGDCGGSCDTIKAYLSMGPGDDGIPDSLIVVVGAMTPSSNSGQVGPTLYQVPFEVRLRESGYPTVAAATGGRNIEYPQPAAQHEATRQLLSHGEAIARRLSALKASGCLSPDGYRCTRGIISAITPLAPQGGVAGMAITVTLTLPWG